MLKVLKMLQKLVTDGNGISNLCIRDIHDYNFIQFSLKRVSNTQCMYTTLSSRSLLVYLHIILYTLYYVCILNCAKIGWQLDGFISIITDVTIMITLFQHVLYLVKRSSLFIILCLFHIMLLKKALI